MKILLTGEITMTINHEQYLNERLKDPEFQQIYLKESILEYIEDGDYCAFYRALEQVIKARTTVKQFAEKIGMHRANLVDILHGKTKAPSLLTISKILNGLGYTLSIDTKLA